MTYKVKEIIIYPIKGLSGISVQELFALPEGFVYDRRWMLIDANGEFITQRTRPEMALFSQKIEGNELIITYKDSSICIKIDEHTSEPVQTKVWDDNAETLIVSQEANTWFSDQLRQQVRLVKSASATCRMHQSSVTGKSYAVSLADGYPYLLVGESSLQQLNEKLSIQVPMNRFRPNIVVTSAEAHEEDQWHQFRIGTAAFTNIKPCGRCNVITIDQETTEMNNEPLKILNTYRKKGNNVLFGTNLVCHISGLVSVGDIVLF